MSCGFCYLLWNLVWDVKTSEYNCGDHRTEGNWFSCDLSSLLSKSYLLWWVDPGQQAAKPQSSHSLTPPTVGWGRESEGQKWEKLVNQDKDCLIGEGNKTKKEVMHLPFHLTLNKLIPYKPSRNTCFDKTPTQFYCWAQCYMTTHIFWWVSVTPPSCSHKCKTQHCVSQAQYSYPLPKCSSFPVQCTFMLPTNTACAVVILVSVYDLMGNLRAFARERSQIHLFSTSTKHENVFWNAF